ncbi:unnamed protein product [Vitrella brassicaformis CCMP3155]|uniref:Aminotransferase class I/classII large domain-containing protein n=1 Tax=Vitrella brassicaformis (strain CCMP3155) TaxID=1169540 RepID=A0A0G4EME6_VITBC|nr:unnamed protein product [Vitrella brassicaformis CCMP3155]|eukprot:CEL98170.1 unnamed protein product [Vitrella brassicaformis CCMP3155]
MPSASQFPIQSIAVTLKDGAQIELDNVEQLLQYSPTKGLPRLVEHLKLLQAREHGKDPGSFDLCVTTGSQDALTKTFEALLNPGDPILIESPTYSGSLAFLEPFGAQLVEVPTDHEGIVPSLLRDILARWSGTPRPKVLYTIPTGSNPSGATMNVERRLQLLEIAKEFDLFIIEDDPYYYLQFLPSRLPSLFCLDKDDGRVVRLDSFSKIVSAGLRLGTATGPRQLIERIELHTQATSLHTSGLSQGLLLALFDHWRRQHDGQPERGFQDHVKGVAEHYRTRRNKLVGAAKICLGETNDKVRFSLPLAGMFLWMEVCVPGVDDTTELIKSRAVDKKVLLLPGSAFYATKTAPPDTQQQKVRKSRQVRAAYSTATDQEMVEAMRRFNDILSSANASQSVSRPTGHISQA